jgi:nucleoside-diphosphate-sugar epimerase
MLNATNDKLSIFLTAATSSLGREATRQLVTRGHRVTGLTDSSDGATLLRKDGALPAYSDPFRAGELKSIIKMAAADVVVHLLPQEANLFAHKGLDAAKLKRTITESTAALLEAAADAGVKFVVFPSFTYVYGNRHGEWVDETASAGRGEFAGAAAQAENKVLHGTVPAVVLRAGTLYGAYDSGLHALGDAALRGRSVYQGDPHAFQNWIHEADLAKAIVLAAEQQPAGQVFNIVDDTPTHAADFAGYVATSLGMPAPAPLSVPQFALERMTNPVQRELLNVSVRAKNGKAKEQLGWTPRYASFRPGVDQALMIWRAESVVS